MSASFPEYHVAEPDLKATQLQYKSLHEKLSVASQVDEYLTVLSEWDALSAQFQEWASMTSIRFHQNTTDTDHQSAKDRLDAIEPKFTELGTTMQRALLDHPLQSEACKITGNQLFEKWLCSTRSFAPTIESDLVTENNLQSKYVALTGGGKVSFQNQEHTLSELKRYLSDADRDTRHASHSALSHWYSDHADQLDSIYHDQVQVRHRMAQQLGYDTFTEMGYQRMQRIGYGPDEVETFRNEVRDQVVPLATEIAKNQQTLLNVDQLMFWDTKLYSTTGNPKPLGDHDWMIDRATEMFAEMGHGLDEFFEEMKNRDAMDLKSRTGKAGGGFCDYLIQYGFPFIFANFNGTRDDVDVFTHEVGHAYQSYNSRNQIAADLIWPTTEACEIHSMALEFLCWPHMEKFYGSDAADELRRIHLTTYLHFLPYGVAIDHFQHLVYAQPDATPAQRCEMWQHLQDTYLPWHDYGDLPHEASGRLWQQKQHIYCSPFYYIDYCLALTGALQFWSKSRKDTKSTMEAYQTLCTLGGSLDYQGLLKSAGLQSPFTPGCLDQVITDAKNYLV